MYLGIDPGLSTGWAVLLSDGVLLSCGNSEHFPTEAIRGAVLETPEYRPGGGTPNVNNLITLARRVGRYEERLVIARVPCLVVTPSHWKGSIDKRRHHLRVDAALTPGERRIVYDVAGSPEKKTYITDVWDGVALAKWAFEARRFANLSL